jgi:predicted hotdog family 3-hydroxylacyl-ACP dehydratase
MESNFLPVAEYLPHEGRMVLLDRVLEADPGRILCAVTLRPDSPFCREGEVPAYVGIEYMAQATGALTGWNFRNHGESVRIGFLVSTRRFTSQVDSFRVGETLLVEARESWNDDEGLSVNDCTIYNPENVPVAQARLMAYQPKDLSAYLKTT